MFESAPYFWQFKSSRVTVTDCENESGYGVYFQSDDVVFRCRHLSTAIEELKRRTKNGDETTFHIWVAPS